MKFKIIPTRKFAKDFRKINGIGRNVSGKDCFCA